jgi:signal transduction histidine kinase
MQLAADLHDNIKSKVTAILLLYRPLLESLFSKKGTRREELLKLWKWLNYLQEDTLKMFTSLKAGDREQEKQKKVDLADLVREELRIMGDITDFRWSFQSDNGAVKIPAAQMPALRRFLGEAALNAWKHSGVRQGVIRLSATGKEIRLAVEDRGKGFDRSRRRDDGTHGLRSMKRRAEELNGTLTVETGAGRGVSLVLIFPAVFGKK